jgi:Protein of unknown function (DUF3237)
MSDIATPGLSLVTELSAKVGAPIDVGETAHGVRRIVPILGGEVSGPRLNGTVMPGGVDYQLWRNDDVTEIHARYVIETAARTRVYVEASGLRRAPPDVMRRLFRGEPVERARFTFGPSRPSKRPIRASLGSCTRSFYALVRAIPTARSCDSSK